jgi:hypothetical protein
MNEFWRWIPGKSVGPFTFGERVEQYVADYALQMRPDCNADVWETYKLPGFESWVCADEGRIVSVHCVDAIDYGGDNLIGMLASSIYDLIGNECEEEKNVGLGYALYYDHMGLTLFIVNDRVSAAACGLIYDD